MATSRLVIVAGKGGVGKTTVAAAMARTLLDAGETVTAVSIGDPTLASTLGVEPTPIAQLLDSSSPAELTTVALDPEDALGSYLDDHGLAALGRRMTRTGMLELVATATPGIKELLILGQLRQLADAEHTGTVVVDGPAAGHAVALLEAPAAMASLARSGRLRTQADLALELLGDADRCQVVLVTLPEHTPVTETIETALRLEDRIGVKLGPVVVNRCAPASPAARPATATLWPDLAPTLASAIDDALDEGHLRHTAERKQVAALEAGLGVPHVELPDAARPGGGVDVGSLVASLGNPT